MCTTYIYTNDTPRRSRVDDSGRKTCLAVGVREDKPVGRGGSSPSGTNSCHLNFQF